MTHQPTDVSVLARTVPAPRAIELSEHHKQQLADRIALRIERSDIRRRRVATAAPVAVVAACLAAVAGLLVTGPGPAAGGSERHPVVAAPAAVSALRAAAAVARVAPTPVVRDDQFVYVRSQVISNDGRFGQGVELGPPHEREIWLGQEAAARTTDGSVIREFGQDWPIVHGSPTPAGAFRPTYAWLAALPTDPDRLLDELANDALVPDRQEPDQAVFDLLGSLVGESLLPPRTAAALFEAATRIPGVEVTPGATDALGRPGIGVSRTDAAYHARTVWVLDARTHEVLGIRWYQLDGRGRATLYGATAVLERTVVDHAGEEPGQAAT